MKRLFGFSLVLVSIFLMGGKMKKNPHVIFNTSMGQIEIELYPDKAPVTVENFLRYVKEKHYDGTIFHRIIPGFVVQGGGYTKDFKEKPTHKPIKNEAGNGLKNERGTLSMARTQVVDSATSQFFINLKNNQMLDHRDNSPAGYGYAVFGKVIKGMDVVDKMAKVKTGSRGFHQDVPLEAIEIKSAKVVE